MGTILDANQAALSHSRSFAVQQSSPHRRRLQEAGVRHVDTARLGQDSRDQATNTAAMTVRGRRTLTSAHAPC
jgi:hypothetical protein